MRIYLDNCCLNRPFDDQQQPRIRLESEAVLLILNYCEIGVHEWIGSDIIDFEIAQIEDEVRRSRLEFIRSYVKEHLAVKPAVEKRAEHFERWGIRGLDAYHLAVAEYGKVDVFLTTDDKLLKQAKYHKREIHVRVENPLTWIKEVDGE
jgi:predicted nucleic acid-binding protein